MLVMLGRTERLTLEIIDVLAAMVQFCYSRYNKFVYVTFFVVVLLLVSCVVFLIFSQ